MRRHTVAVDAMGGDRAPDAIIDGARRAIDDIGVDVLLFGDEARLRAHLGTSDTGALPDHLDIVHTSETIAMDDDPAATVRAKRDSSIVRCAEAVRDGRADAFVGAGNTGATMAAALLRFGRIPGVARPAIAVPIPIPGADRRQLLVDGGATVDPDPEWLVQWARLGQAYAKVRLGLDAPTVGLLSNGEEPGKGDALRKAAFPLLAEGVKDFVGNVEGRDLARVSADVIMTDGFTGNVALKTLEGAMQAMAGLVFGVVDEPAFATVADALRLRLLEAAADLLPDNTGGALLLGVRGVCIISHGSSSASAIVNAVRVAHTCIEADVVARLTEAVS